MSLRRFARFGAAVLLAAILASAAAAAGRHSGFLPNDPMVPQQWYLQADGALNAFALWPTQPTLPGAGVKVAVIDSGIDGGHPEFQGGIVSQARSFVGGRLGEYRRANVEGLEPRAQRLRHAGKS